MLYTKYMYESSEPCSFRKEDFFKLHLKYRFFYPMTYLCNRLEPFQQFWKGTTQGPFLLSLVKIPFNNMKALCLVVSDKKIFQNCILKTYFSTLWPTYATNWNSFNNFGRGTPRDHSCEVWSKFNEWFQSRSRLNKQEGSKGPGSLTWGKGQRSLWSHFQRTTNVVHQIFVEDLWMMLYIKYESTGPCTFRQEDFWKLHFENLYFDPVTYLCNQSEPFEQLWKGTTQGSFLWSLVKIQWAVSEEKMFK